MKIYLMAIIAAFILQLYLGFYYKGEYLIGGLYGLTVLLWGALLLKMYNK